MSRPNRPLLSAVNAIIDALRAEQLRDPQRFLHSPENLFLLNLESVREQYLESFINGRINEEKK